MASLATLTAGLAHEIRNPLNAALLQLELLGASARGCPRAEPARRIGECAQAGAVGDPAGCRGCSRSSSSLARPRTLERYPVDVRALCDYVATMQRPLARRPA
jgi:signal transduction histidine kinase